MLEDEIDVWPEDDAPHSSIPGANAAGELSEITKESWEVGLLLLKVKIQEDFSYNFGYCNWN